MKVVLEVKGSVNPLPESVPPFDQLPLGAEQLVALVELQVRVGRPLYATDDGETERVAVGAGLFSVQEELAPPPEPLQTHVQVERLSELLMLVPGLHP